jgi:hypothetical protein
MLSLPMSLNPKKMSSTDLLIISGLFAVVVAIFAVYSNIRKGEEADAAQKRAEDKELRARKETDAEKDALRKIADAASAESLAQQNKLAELVIARDDERAAVQREQRALQAAFAANKIARQTENKTSTQEAIDRKFEAAKSEFSDTLKASVIKRADIQRRENAAADDAQRLNALLRPSLVKIQQACINVMRRPAANEFFEVLTVTPEFVPEKVVMTTFERQTAGAEMWGQLFRAQSTQGAVILVEYTNGRIASPNELPGEGLTGGAGAVVLPEVHFNAHFKSDTVRIATVSLMRAGFTLTMHISNIPKPDSTDISELTSDLMIIGLSHLRVKLSESRSSDAPSASNTK